MKVTATHEFGQDEHGFVRASGWADFLQRYDDCEARVTLDTGKVVRGWIAAGDSDSQDLVLALRGWPDADEPVKPRTVAIHIPIIKTLTVKR